VAQGAEQPERQTATPPSVITKPPRQWGPDAPPTIYSDPDVIVLDAALRPSLVGNAPIRRLWTGGIWAEGPAWSGQGQYLVFSDVVGDVQRRYLWEDGRVTTFRSPSYNSNGNTFDFQGRQVSAQHFFRRVVRWEHDGSVTVIADAFEGKPLNSPNDLVSHPDGSVWFTDPPYGDTLSEGHPDLAAGMGNPAGRFNPRLGSQLAGLVGGRQRELPTNTYRWDPSGRLDVVVGGDEFPYPNGLCFSPDYKTLYVVSTGKFAGDPGPDGKHAVFAFDVDGAKVSNMRLFTDMFVDGVRCGPDGIRADVNGNLWISSSAPLGYAGVLIYSPQGKLLGRIRLPEICANVAFGGPKRNILFMCASQSLYALQVQTQGAAPG
jgi:gluconolactonase